MYKVNEVAPPQVILCKEFLLSFYRPLVIDSIYSKTDFMMVSESPCKF